MTELSIWDEIENAEKLLAEQYDALAIKVARMVVRGLELAGERERAEFRRLLGIEKLSAALLKATPEQLAAICSILGIEPEPTE